METIRFYSVEEVAALLKVSKRTVYRNMQAGKLHAVKIGNFWRISQENLDSFLQEREHI